MTAGSLESALRRTARRWRGAHPQNPGPPNLGPSSTFEALLDQRYKDLASEVAEIKGRINGLIFVVIGGVIAELAVRLLFLTGEQQLRAGMPALRPYQIEPLRAILHSVRRRAGHTFTVMMSRQAGKNELSAQLEVAILALAAGRGGDGIKASPTFRPQTLNSIERLKRRLNDAGFAGFWSGENGYALRLGQARMLFFSASPGANVVGATAGLLLEIDEAQDVSSEKYARDFRPMGATSNVTTVLYGTA